MLNRNIILLNLLPYKLYYFDLHPGTFHAHQSSWWQPKERKSHSYLNFHMLCGMNVGFLREAYKVKTKCGKIYKREYWKCWPRHYTFTYWTTWWTSWWKHQWMVVMVMTCWFTRFSYLCPLSCLLRSFWTCSYFSCACSSRCRQSLRSSCSASLVSSCICCQRSWWWSSSTRLALATLWKLCS